MRDQNSKTWWIQKRFMIPVILVFLLIGIRLVLEPVLLKVANEKAKTVNPVFQGHISDLDLAILRGGVKLENITAKIKESGKQFAEIDEVSVDLAWRELFKGNIKIDVAVDEMNLQVTKELLAAVKKLPKEEKKKELPFELSRFDIEDSTIAFPEYPGLNNQKQLVVNNIHGSVTGITGEKDSPLAKYEIFAGLSKKDDVKVSGNFDISSEPPRWDMNAKVTKFDLAAGNKSLAKLIPMNIKKGTLDIYSEVKSEDGKIYGYVKPFLNDVEFMGNKNEFKGGKHFFVELAGAVTDFVFQHSEKKSVATRVPFFYEKGKFGVEGGGALVDAVQHGLIENDPVDRGIEQKYRLNTKNPKEVQAQEEKLDEKK